MGLVYAKSSGSGALPGLVPWLIEPSCEWGDWSQVLYFFIYLLEIYLNCIFFNFVERY